MPRRPGRNEAFRHAGNVAAAAGARDGPAVGLTELLRTGGS